MHEANPSFNALPLLQVSPLFDQPTLLLLLGVMALLMIAALAGWVLQRQEGIGVNPLLVKNVRNRVHAWWIMWTVLGAAFALEYLFSAVGRVVTVTLFGLLSFWALREYITMTPTRRGDHRTLFWTFFLLTPLQFILVGLGREWYEIYSILIPVYASLFIPARIAMSGDPKRFLERSAKIQLGLLICVYALSHAPALLDMKLNTFVSGEAVEWNGSTAGLLLYFVLLVQLSDLFQFGWGKLLGKHVIAPEINANRSWEGFFGGVATTALVGVLLRWATPFRIEGAVCMSAIVAIMGFAGSMVMSAIKRDRGVKDYGTLVQGHAGLLDRIDSLCFAAPVFFHLIRHFLERP